MNKDELKSILEQHWLWIVGNGGKRANLRGANLSGANLRGANLSGANLRGVDLQGANLRDADLRYADLQYADLQGVDLQSADLQYADLRGANLSGANLRGANLRGANLSGANLRGVDLQSAGLQSANLRGANLRGANLSGANLRGADLQYADLQYADLQYADLQGANLSGANLDYSYLPLWCGSKGMIVDRRIAAQIAANFCALVCDDADYRAARTAILEFARTSHRAKDLGLLEEIVKECNDVATQIDVALRKRIAELEGKIDQLTAHSDIERQDDKSSNDTQTQTIVYGKEDSEVQE